MVITRSGRNSLPAQPATAAAAPAAADAIVPVLQAPGNEVPIPILPIVQAPMAPPIQAPAIPVPRAAAQDVGAQATVDGQVQGGPASNSTNGSANRSRTTTNGSKVKSVSGRSSAGMAASNNSESLSKKNRQNSTGGGWPSGASGSQSVTQHSPSNGQGGSREVGASTFLKGLVFQHYLPTVGNLGADFIQVSSVQWATHNHGTVIGSSYVLKRNSDRRQLYFSINDDVVATEWFTETDWPGMDLGELVLLEEHPAHDRHLDAIGMIQFIRCSIYGGWQRSTLQYTCSTRIFFDILRDCHTSDHNLNLCLQEIYALTDKHKIYLVAAYGGSVVNMAKKHVASRRHIEITEEHHNNYVTHGAGNTPHPSSSNGQMRDSTNQDQVEETPIKSSYTNKGKGKRLEPQPDENEIYSNGSSSTQSHQAGSSSSQSHQDKKQKN